MSRDGSITLSDVRSQTLAIICEACGRRGRYDVARLIEQRGDAKLTDLLQTLVRCPKAQWADVHDWCRAVYYGLSLDDGL
jgi:hypothetical protein